MRRRDRLTAFFFLASLATVTWEKVHWAPAGGDVELSEILAAAFLVFFVGVRLGERDPKFSRTAARLCVFAAAFVIVYLVGFYNLGSQQALDQFAKGLGKFLLHFAFFVAAVAYVSRRSERFYWRALGWFFAGMAINAAYGLVQLAAARAGYNLDGIVLAPLTHGASQINIYGAVEGSKVYRPNALTGDPNHLAIMLDLPLLVLAPLYVRLERSHPLLVPLGLCIALLLLGELTTLSRSGLLGLAAGFLVLAGPYRRKLRSAGFLVPLAGVSLIVSVSVLLRLHFFETVLRSRLHVSTGSTHFTVYGFIPQVLHSHPLFGLGLNTFSVYYELVTGKPNWGPHSFYVAVMVESGLVGTVVFALFLWYVFERLRAARALGRLLAAAHDPAAARVRPLAWGLTAALVATMAANAFYLTMSFFYFYVFVLLALTAPLVFMRRLTRPGADAHGRGVPDDVGFVL